jgi:hypothetical protein
MNSKKNIYTHQIDIEDLVLKNCPRNEFREKLERIRYKGYRVEKLSDGREIIVTKPGGKFTFGSIKREDFMVWVRDPNAQSLWLISHKNIFEDLENKGEKDRQETIRIIDALERVFFGEEPDDVLKSLNPPLGNPGGEVPETLMKAYKWIWGQEDCNYPNGEGREMSMKVIRDLKKRLSN